MAIPLTSEASLDFVKLQNMIHDEESAVVVRLASLAGKTESGFPFNAHTYQRVADNKAPFSKLFPVPSGPPAGDDPAVKTWLAQNPTQSIICENDVYVSGSPAYIAVVR